MQWIAQHKGLALSIALVIGSVALAPAMAGGNLGGGFDVAGAADDMMAKATGSGDASLDGLSGKLGGKGKVAATADDVTGDATGKVDGMLDGGDLNLRNVVGGSVETDQGSATTRNGVQVTDEQAHVNPDLAVAGEHGSAATENGVHLNYADPTDPSAAVESGADLETEHVSASTDLTGGN